jgi:hypothetical protein
LPFRRPSCPQGNDPLADTGQGHRDHRGKFGTPPARVRALETISTELGCHAIYAFAHLTRGEPAIRFATAAEVAVLADQEEAAYKGINRYHVTIDQFGVTVGRISELLAHQ